MLHRPESSPDSPACQDSGLWLLVRPLASPAIALPVPRQACLGLTRAVLAGGDDPVAWRVLAGGDPSVVAWIDSQRPLAPHASKGAPGFRGARPPLRAVRRDSLVGSLSKAIRLGRPAEAAPEDSVSVPAREASSEALAVVAAVDRMLEHERIAGRFEEALAEARLEAMRELAYGAGHEINNPLANIATRAQALLLDEKDPERRRRLATIVDQSFRARDMIGGLMLFARPPRAQCAEVDVGSLVVAAIDSAQASAAARGVRLEYSPPPSPIGAFVDRGQIEEAVRAVVINAIEAVDDGGHVSLAAGVVPAEEGAWLEIIVADDGRGMDGPTLRRAFDPFFSGREAGRGAGLGLSKAWRFVEASGGEVLIDSRPGEGTRVSIVLPACQLVEEPVRLAR